MIEPLLQNRYRIEGEIGRGGMGTVFRAYDTLLERPVAIKILKQSDLDRESKSRLLREAQAVARLNHPHIVAVYDAGEEGGIPYIVMELIHGTTLRADPLRTFEEITMLGVQVCKALEHAHAHGVIHRDLKPENIMLTDDPSAPPGVVADNWVKLTDFGLAVTGAGSRLTETGAIAGTLFYLAPERLQGQEASIQSDLFSLGVILYELLTSELPFCGDNPGQVILRLISQPPVSPRDRRGEIPLALEAIVLRLLEKKPENRFTSSLEVFQALEGLSGQGSPIQSARTQGNLPLQITSFIGREDEIQKVQDMFASASLVTLTGPGGCGKTRLAVEVAQRSAGQFPQGVWLVELASLADPTYVPQTVAASLGLREARECSWESILIDHLRDRRLLLVIDNCEHLIDACAQLAGEILRRCPQVILLTSSREALGISGEFSFRVPSLPTPDLRHLSPASEILHYEAVRLFVERAASVLPGFTLTPANAASVAQICTRLDGIPLAIELAAARVPLLRVEQIAARLDDAFRLLTGGSRSVLPRQQTLRLSMDWSYNLLSEMEQAILRRLTVFSGGWTLEAAENVCEDSGCETLDLLASLVKRSLSIAERIQGQDTRYRMLETIRQYGSEKLYQAGESEMARIRHLDFYRHHARQRHDQGESEDAWIQRLSLEGDNLRAALEWSLGGGDVDAGLELAGLAWFYWYTNGVNSEGRQWLGRLLEKSQSDSYASGKALVAAGVLAWQQGDYAEARPLAEQGTAILKRCGGQRDKAEAVHLLGHIIFDQRDYDTARLLFQESLQLFDEVGDKLYHLTLISDLGMVNYHLGDYQVARLAYQESLTLARLANERGAEAQALGRLSDLSCLEGEYTLAEIQYREALRILRELNYKQEIAGVLHNLSYVAMQAGEIQNSRTLLEESLAMQLEVGNKQGIAECLFGYAGLLAKEGKFERAAQLFGAAQAYLGRVGAPLAPADLAEIEKYKKVVREAMGNKAFQASWETGQSLTVDLAVSLAMMH